MTAQPQNTTLDKLFEEHIEKKHGIFKEMLAPILRPTFEAGYAAGFSAKVGAVYEAVEDRCPRCIRLLHKTPGVQDPAQYCLGHND